MKKLNWVSYDGVSNDMDWFETRDEAEKAINANIRLESDEARDNGFSDDCEEYAVLQVVGRAKLSHWKKREDQILDEDGCDEEGDYWPEEIIRYCHLKYVPEETERKALIQRTCNWGRVENPDGSVSHSVHISFIGAINNIVRTNGRESFSAREAARLHSIARKAWFEGDFETVADYFGAVV